LNPYYIYACMYICTYVPMKQSYSINICSISAAMQTSVMYYVSCQRFYAAGFKIFLANAKIMLKLCYAMYLNPTTALMLYMYSIASYCMY